MTTYAKIENNKLICASNNLGITGLADNVELCLANGFTAYTEEEISGYYAGTHQIIDGVLTNISQTPEYIAEQKLKENAIIKQDILKQLSEIDAKSIRALRDGNATYITQYEAQAQDLREQLNATM